MPKVFVPRWLVYGFVLKYQLKNYQKSLGRLLLCNAVLGFKNRKGFGRDFHLSVREHGVHHVIQRPFPAAVVSPSTGNPLNCCIPAKNSST